MTGATGEPYVFPTHPSGANLIDWNRDGLLDTGSIRAHVTQAPWRWAANYGYDHPIMQEIEDMPDSNSITAPAGARFSIGGSRWTYVVVNDQTTNLFKFTRSNLRVGGWPQGVPYTNIGTTPHRADAQPAVVEFADGRRGPQRLHHDLYPPRHGRAVDCPIPARPAVISLAKPREPAIRSILLVRSPRTGSGPHRWASAPR